MFKLRLHLISAVCLVTIVGLASGQRFFNPNEVSKDQQDVDYEEPDLIPIRLPSSKRPASSVYKGGSSLTPPSQPAAPRAPPVQILKQINKHNEDGSYTYGFEGADGSFKIETKLANGEVKGKYGYVDDTGKVRVVEYGANRYGFQPAGEGITVAPPTLVDESKLQKKKKVPSNLFAPDTKPVVEEDSPEYDEDLFRAEPDPQPQPQIVSRPSSRRGSQQRQRVSVQAQSIPQRPSANFEFGVQQQLAQAQPQAQPQLQFQPQSQPQPQLQQFSGFVGESRASSSSLGPVPPRAQIAGAAPVPTSVGSSQAVRPAPQFLFQQSDAPQPRQAVRHFTPASSFDELEKQYALPSGGSNPTHDITFSGF